jgi:polar amino acid transport system substrate-binding protein
MKHVLLCAAALSAAMSVPAAFPALADARPPEAAVRELSPGGTLRVAVAVGTTATASRVVRDPVTGAPKGVAVDLAVALAERLGVPLQLVPFSTTGAITDTAAAGAWDVAFLPADVERAKRLDFSTPYYLYESAYLVRAGSAARSLDALDRAGVRIGVVANSSTMHNASRVLRKASLVPFRTAQEALEALRTGRVDAMGMGREALDAVAQKLPGSRILESEARASGVSAAVPKDRSAGLAYLTAFIEEAKAKGTLAQSLEAAGIKSGVIAPPAKVE